MNCWKLPAWARREINRIKGFRCWGRELLSDEGVTGLDQTKLIIDGLEAGFDGFSTGCRSLRRLQEFRWKWLPLIISWLYSALGISGIRVDHLIRALRDLSGRKETSVPEKHSCPLTQLAAGRTAN
jgi:hypothetical protein